jgi:hypothetical protein
MALEGAMDHAENVDMKFEVEVPTGEYDDSIEVLETTPLDLEEASAKICYFDVSLAT